jgi:hypothetical protein
MLRHPFFYKYILDIKPTTGRNTMPLWGKTDSAGDKPKWATTLQNMDTAGRQIIFVDNTEASLAVNRARGFNAPGWWAYYTVEQSDGTLRYRGQELLVAISQTALAAGDQADDAVAADAAPTPITISSQPANQTAYTPAGSITAYTNDAATTLAGEADEVYVLTGLEGGVAGTGAAFTVTRTAGGAIASVAITAVGTGFAATETITILGSLIGGDDTTDDLVVTVTTVGTAAATFSVTAAGQATLQYQWQRQTTGTTWSNISGATNSSLALTGLTTASNGYKYRVRISSTGGALTVTSNSATLTVDNNIFA